MFIDSLEKETETYVQGLPTAKKSAVTRALASGSLLLLSLKT